MTRRLHSCAVAKRLSPRPSGCLFRPNAGGPPPARRAVRSRRPSPAGIRPSAFLARPRSVPAKGPGVHPVRCSLRRSGRAAIAVPVSAGHRPAAFVARKHGPASRIRYFQSPWSGDHLTPCPNHQLTTSGLRLPIAISGCMTPVVSGRAKNRVMPLDSFCGRCIIDLSVPIRVRPPVTADAAPPQGRATRQPGCTTSRPRDIYLPIASFSGRFGILFCPCRRPQTAYCKRGRG